jgi:hypothetical protein
MNGLRTLWLALALTTAVASLWPGPARASGPAQGALAPLAGPDAVWGRTPSAPWTFAGLPDQKLPVTRFTVDVVQDRPVLRVEANGSYGNLIHRLDAARADRLSWRWRVEQPLRSANLQTRQGDDVALKVCALFDMPRERVPFVERQLMRLAEARMGEPLPNATVCYVWDPSWPADHLIPNAHSRRVRYITLGASSPQWQTVQRDLAADFLRAFGDETRTVPRLQAIAIGADADNSGGQSLGFIADLQLRTAAPR